jgi:hypothetical protein
MLAVLMVISAVPVSNSSLREDYVFAFHGRVQVTLQFTDTQHRWWNSNGDAHVTRLTVVAECLLYFFSCWSARSEAALAQWLYVSSR